MMRRAWVIVRGAWRSWAELRDRRFDPPPLIPDPVTREVAVDRVLTDRHLSALRRSWTTAGWAIEDQYVPVDRPWVIVYVLRRYDGEMGNTDTTRRGR